MDRVDHDTSPKNEGSINFAKSDGRSSQECNLPGRRTGWDRKVKISSGMRQTRRHTCAKDGRGTLQTEGERNFVGADGNTPSEVNSSRIDKSLRN